jgi:hypothetical protein
MVSGVLLITGRLDAAGCACGAGPGTAESAAGLASAAEEGETSTNTVCPQDCQEWCATQAPTLITGQSRQGQPPLECSVCSPELPMCVRGPMRIGMCVRVRVRRKYLFLLLNNVDTD